jgi:hypothetical protein
MKNETEKKLTSRKFWFSAWSALTFTVIGIVSLINKSEVTWLSSCMPLLVGIVGAYVGIGRAKEK